MDDRAHLRAAKARLVDAMDQGVPWEDAVATAGLLTSRASAYHIWIELAIAVGYSTAQISRLEAEGVVS